MPFKKFVTILLVTQLILLAGPVQAQAPAAQPPAGQASPPAAQPQPQPQANPAPPPAPLAPLPTVQDLKVLVLEGQRSINNSTSHVAIQPVVEVRDQNDRPVEGATVIFRLPPSGPGGAFPGNSPTYTSRSTVQGQAAAVGFIPNDLQGRFEIHVTATLQNRTGEVTITQTNSANTLALQPPPPESFLKKHKYLLLGGAAAVVVGVVLVFTVGHSKSTPAVTISPGQVTINQ